MTEQEAITILFYQCTTPTGFLQRLPQGPGVDQQDAEQRCLAFDALLQDLEQLRQAFDALQQAWAEQTCVPREAVLALTYLDETLPATFEQYSEFEDLYFDFITRITDLLMAGRLPEEFYKEMSKSAQEPSESDYSFLWFWEEWAENAVIPERPLTETEALAVLRKHLTSGSGLLVALRCRMGALQKLGMAKAWFLISQALETLQPIWAADPCIPKDIARGLAQIREGITNGWTFYEDYPTIQEDLLRVADDLWAKVQRCLNAHSATHG